MEPLAQYEEIGSVLKVRYDAETGQMFGKKCLKFRGKAFAAFYQDDMAFKLTDSRHAEALKLEGSKLWDPSGKNKPMKDWVQVSRENASIWLELAEHALKLVP